MGGAPIGTRVACACANLVMEWLWERVEEMFSKSDESTGMAIHMKGNFVDDARILLNTMKKGTIFEGNKFIWREEQERMDENITREEVTYREFGRCLNSICQTLNFTLEKHSDFSDNWLPTLDFMVRPDHLLNRLEHNYYEKPMNTKWVLPQATAMDPSSKRQILSNEMARRLARVDPEQFQKYAVEVINQYDRKLIFSRYDLEDRRRIIEGGIDSHLKRKEACLEKGERFYKTAKETEERRNQKKLTDKQHLFSLCRGLPMGSWRQQLEKRRPSSVSKQATW